MNSRFRRTQIQNANCHTFRRMRLRLVLGAPCAIKRATCAYVWATCAYEWTTCAYGMGHMGQYMSPCSEPSLLPFFTSHEQLAEGAGQHHGERLGSRDMRQRTSTSTIGRCHSLMLTQVDINCIFCWPMLRAAQLSFGVLDKFLFSSLYNSTSRLNVFEKIAPFQLLNTH